VDVNRFDTLSRSVAQRHDRRTTLQRALMVGAGSALGLAGVAAVADPALAKSCEHNKDCPANKKCKNKKKQNNGKRKGRCK
jgi:hypothetical protein